MKMISNESSIETQCIRLGRANEDGRGFINPPIQRGSTYTYHKLSEYKSAKQDRYYPDAVAYGRYGTPESVTSRPAHRTADLQ